MMDLNTENAILTAVGNNDLAPVEQAGSDTGIKHYTFPDPTGVIATSTGIAVQADRDYTNNFIADSIVPVAPTTEVTPAKFRKWQHVLHIKKGTKYQITGMPGNFRIEKTWEPAYAYVGEDGVTIIRSQTEMEDGRFVNWPNDIV